MATTSLVMRAVAEERLSLDTKVSSLLEDWTAADRSEIRVRHLLEHSAGFPAHLRLWELATGRGELRGRASCRTAGTAARRGVGVLRYRLHGARIRGRGRRRAGRSTHQFDELRRAWDGTTTFRPSSALLARIAPTEYDAVRDRVVHGDVHDENARALGGVAGHAGLFGTASDVGAFARLVLRTFREPTGLGTPSLMRTFATECRVPSSSRALGWDTMRPTSSCGSLMSARRDWTHGLHRNVAVDRSRARLVRGAAHEPDPSDANKRRAPCASSRAFTMRL